MEELENYNEKMFERIKHIDENENEYWEARELQKVLELRNGGIKRIIDKAIIACNKSKNKYENHFVELNKMVSIGSGAKRIQDDFRLSRYACYLIVQNGDSKKKVIALGQTYFALQTRKVELTEEEYNKLSEDEKRIYKRRQTKNGNKSLYKIASLKGVRNFDRFTNAGYKGLYNGETADDIARRKGLRYR